MTRINIVVVAAMLSAAAMASTFAQAQVSEPAAFQAQHPDRDVLNGGQLTPAARAAVGQYEGANAAFAAQYAPAAPAPAVHPRRRHRHQ